MHTTLLITSLILFLVSVRTDQRYAATKDIPNPYDAQKVAFTDDDQIVILYNTKQFDILFYRYFDFKLLHSSTTDLLGSLESFTNAQNTYCLITGETNGVVSLTTFDSKSSKETLLTTIDNCNVIKATASVSQKSYAVLCENTNSIFVGNLQEPQGEVKTIVLDFTAKAISWHPTQARLAVAGALDTNKIIIVNTVTDERQDYSEEVTKKTVDVQFSADGQYLAYISEQSEFVTILNTKDKTKNYLSASQATQLRQIKRSGNLLSAHDEYSAYVWVFNGQNYGKYTSFMKSTGLSKTGAFLFTYEPITKHIKLNEICPSQYFVNAQQTCADCLPPCKACFVKETQCSSCVQNYYLDEAAPQCKICVQNCVVCSDAQTCTTCKAGFFLDGALCTSCFAKFTGCATCNSTNCSQCLKEDHWELYKGVCTCMAKFVQVVDKCLACPIHCLSCTDPQTCEYCDIFQNRKLAPVEGKCICDSKFFENTTGDCAPCLVGCLTCDNKLTCEKCDGDNHWALEPKDNTCVCASGYYNAKNECTSCSVLRGCLACTSAKICSACDKDKHWTLDTKTHTCTCETDYILSGNECLTCSALIEGCIVCKSKDICEGCSEGYSLNGDTHRCEKVSDGGVNVVVVIVVGVCVLVGLAVGSFFIVKMIRKRNSRKVETLLQTEGENEEMT